MIRQVSIVVSWDAIRVLLWLLDFIISSELGWQISMLGKHLFRLDFGN